MRYINYNGHLIDETQAPPLIDGTPFRFIDGLFETILAINGVVQLFDLHFARLSKGISELAYDVPAHFNKNFVLGEIDKTIARNQQQESQRVRLQLSSNNTFSYIIEVLPLEKDILSYHTGLKISIADQLQPLHNPTNQKKIEPAFYRKARLLVRELKCDDVLCLHGTEVIESSIANIFWVKNGSVYTPPLSSGCVAGVMRQYLFDTLNNTRIMERKLTTDELLDADEVFLTNALRRIKSIAEIDGHHYSDSVTRTIHAQLYS